MEHQPLQFGPRIEPYELLEELGRGGSGVVYKALDPRVERVVALKVLHPEVTHRRELQRQLRREAASIARLRHSNIALLYDFSPSEPITWLAVEYIPGQTLRALNAVESLSPYRVLNILTQIANALDYMHRQGVIHRDVKPSNIMVGPGDHAVLIDFGLANAQDTSLTTPANLRLGTPSYMAPEQAAGRPVTHHTDQYALAVIAYELLTGVAPFSDRPAVAIVHAHLYETPAPPSEYRPALPTSIDTVLLRALSKQPRQRYSSTRAFVEELYRAMRQPMRRRMARVRVSAQLALLLVVLLLLRQSTFETAGSAGIDRPAAASIQRLWSYDPGLVGGSPPLLVRNNAVVANLDGTLTALQALSGQVQWHLQLETGFFGALGANESMLFVGTSEDELLALDPDSGQIRWRTTLLGMVQQAPRALATSIVVGTSDGYVYALNSASGSILWRRMVGGSAPLMLAADTSAILASSGPWLTRLDPNSGELIWRVQLGAQTTTAPIRTDTLVAVGTVRGRLVTVGLDDGAERWHYQAHGGLSAAPAFADGRLFVADHAGTLAALDPGAGAILWEQDFGKAIADAPLISQDTLFFGTSEGWLYAVDAASGALIERVTLEGSIDTMPASADTILIVRADQLYALERPSQR